MQTLSTRNMTCKASFSATLSGDASDLGFRPAPAITVESHRTRHRVMFRLVETRRDADNDVMCWVYAPVGDTRVSELVIYND